MATALEDFCGAIRGKFRGDLIRHGNPGFAEASRIWNAIVARTPGAIARCADVADIRLVVRHASEAGILTAVRCGGHSLAGFGSCDGGLVIDLSRLRAVQVDAGARRARFGGGCLLGNVDKATQQHGLVFPAGVVSHTGAGGLVLGGGTGWLTRLLGLSCDNVAGFTLVTADGVLIRASDGENSELYWALRGGGGNFGVVTEFEVRLHPLTSVLLASSYCPQDDIIRVLQEWREFMPAASDELKWNISLVRAPNDDRVPEEIRGKPALSSSIVWFGDEASGQRHTNRIFSIGRHVGRSMKTTSYLTLQTMADSDFPHGRRYYTKSGYFAEFTDSVIEIMVQALASIPSQNTQIELAYLGGAAGRVNASETAFGDRSAPFILNLLADWKDPADDAANVSWVRNLFSSLRPHMKPGVYVNFMSGDEQERVPEAYQDRWQRLLRVKTQYDPSNFFRLNQNIAPLTK
ncbi:MAG: FAD-binding oxidoreductase [Candidatus Acidiferrales bacterium]